MNVLFDHQIFYLQRFGGISRYYIELAAELQKIRDCHPTLVVPYHRNDYLQRAGDQDYIFTYRGLRRKFYYNRFHDKAIERNEYELRRLSLLQRSIVHETFYLHRTPVKAPRVITVHDMIPELINDHATDRNEVIAGKKKAIQEADIVITISEHTRKDLVRLYPEASDKTFMVYHGLNKAPTPKPIRPPANKPYVLFVGNRGGYKNFDQLLEVYAADRTINKAFDLVCFGGGQLNAAEIEKIAKYGLQPRVHWLSGSDELLNAVYVSAAALAYVSAYEGFGMPPLEAMRFSCPVLCPDNSASAEVAGNAAVLYKNNDQSDLQAGLNQILFDQELRKSMVQNGLQRSSEFSWEKCAAQTHALYQKLL